MVVTCLQLNQGVRRTKMNPSNPFESQLLQVIAEYEDALNRSSHDDASDTLPNREMRDLQTRCLAALERAGGRSSIYFERAVAIGEVKASPWEHLGGQIGIAKSLLSDIRHGYLRSHEELVHGDIFADFLEMAEHLVRSGYKDAGAVIAGSTLESHLRNLCAKHGIATHTGGGPKRADGLNSELTKSGAYSKLDQKNVTAWLGLRNDAAHGNFTNYDQNQVAFLVSSVRDFLTRHPA